MVKGFTYRVCEYRHFRNKQVRRNTFFRAENPFKTHWFTSMIKLRLLLLGFLLISSFLPVKGQRTYAANSVLASGNWYKLSTGSTGIYKVDLPILASLGINTSNLSSSSIRLFGNGGQMLPEANAASRADDLQEVAIFMTDGGDGIFNGNDFFLFYAPGPDEWLKDSVNQRFFHRKNIYSDKSYYFLTIGSNGKRTATAPLIISPGTVINSFSERYFHELDTVNFLGSGKEWYGEELSGLPGRSLTRNFLFTIPDIVQNSVVGVRTECIARSAGVSSRFDITINNQPAGQLTIPPIGSGIYDLFAQSSASLLSANTQSATVNVGYTYVPGSFNSQGWINWLEVFARRNINLNGNEPLFFRDWNSVGSNNGEFVVRNATASAQVWDITDFSNPVRIQGTFSNSEFRFVNTCERLREYVAFNATTSLFKTPVSAGKINNQDLHGAPAADFLIVTHPLFYIQAQRLAQLHQQNDNLRSLVVTTEQVYNEFSSGSPDPAAIRDFVKMLYDRAAANPANRPKYLLLFGDASYDYKDRLVNNTNLVPAWQNNFSLDPLSTYASDDFFGILDDNEDINSGLVTNLLDIGIGRVPAKNAEEAKNFVDKVAVYLSPQSLGSWRNNLTFIADDEDNNLHLQDAEIITGTAAAAGPVFDQQKIYLDAFRQESGAGGSRYPQANEASNNQVYNGTLIWNYNGHGGSSRLAEENILDQPTLNNWNNPERLTLFVTATCDFAPYDNPFVNSLGENILLRPKTGAIALMTTTRLVFAFSNRIINNNYLQFALQPDANGKYRSLGDAVKDAKNFTYQNSADIANNRKFTLLGDPALRLAFPKMKARISRVNGIDVSIADTLNALEKITMDGEITDWQGNILNDFNGNVYPSVFDKTRIINTLGNDPGSQVTSFVAQGNTLFKGKATVANGRFSFTFKVPRDINYQFGNGRVSLYAENGISDANGILTNLIVGGNNGGTDADKEGPEIKAYLNDELFVNGGITNQNPVLIVKLADTSGINTAGTGIGHDIIAILDNDNNRYFILNDFYQGELNSYQQGTVRFQLPVLDPGPHTLKIKAWDVVNNSNEALLDFIVVNDTELELNHVLNYPNPFTNSTTFWFEHNKPGQPLAVQLQVMTITGRVIKTMEQVVTTEGNRSTDITWDGRDEYGEKPGRGVYLYKLRVIAPGRKQKEVLGKLVIL